MNLANKLTLLRIMIIPFFLLFMVPFPNWFVELEVLSSIRNNLDKINDFILNYGNYFAAFFFLLAASTDGLDGYIARKRKQITNLGKFLDPIADKLLITAALIALSQRNEISGWVATIIIGREFIVTGLRLIAASDGIVISASKLGKLKTVIQIVAISATLIENYPISVFSTFPLDIYLWGIATIITVYSGYDYIVKNYNVLNIEEN